MRALAPVIAAVSQPELHGALGPTDQAHLLWARETQAMSFAFHIPLVCFGVAFPAIVLFLEWRYHRTHDDAYKALAKRWSKVMSLVFAVGVVTGTILSFELGLLWPDFMATFGGVFGLAFGLEGFSFFLEAIFIAIYVYGWDRIPPRWHLLSGIPIPITGITGSMMVIAVNGWMNHPVGFDVVNGRVTNVHPWSALFNPFFWHELVHMYLAAYMVVGFIVAGIYAVAWRRGERSRYVRIGFVIPLTVAALAAPAQVIVGDWAGRAVGDYQPLKLAAAEGLGHTEKGAAFHIGGYYSDGDVKLGVPVPRLLSILAKHNPNATVLGLDTVPARDRPPVNVVRFAFQGMVGIGSLLAAFGVVYLVARWRLRRLPSWRWLPPAAIVAGPLATIALLCGWVVTEVGRQPWVVYQRMRTAEAVTDAGGLPVAFFFLLAVYLTLLAGFVWLLRRLAARSPETELARPGPRMPT